MTTVRIAATSLFLLASVGGSARAATAKGVREVHFKTEDGWTLAARYRPAAISTGRVIAPSTARAEHDLPRGTATQSQSPGAPASSAQRDNAPAQPLGAVALFHGLMAGKDEWLPLEEALSARGVATLAVDLRGHGGSLSKGKKKLSVRDLLLQDSREDWNHIPRDARAAYRFLRSRGYKRIGLVGASVGANMAAMAAGSLPRLRFLVLLSPGEDYQGLEPAEALRAYGSRPLLLAASGSDGYALQSCRYFHDLRLSAGLPADWIQAPSGHGAQMFQDAGTMERIVSWIVQESR